MNESLTDLKGRILAWAQAAGERGLVSETTVDTLASLSEQTPANLFDQAERPLVVGFFGGTGVGKSTLLNRLASENIARTGVERPTSREVTLYLHQSVSVSHLPKDFPVDKINTATHSNHENRHILWIDMPDFDSSETTNRDQVNNWLPHIDLLIYVVSPERYKDDNGWRLLLEHGHRHAWCFVINHWDTGNDVQRKDFIRMLDDAGLGSPLLFCTDSSDTRTDGLDELDALKVTVQSLADSNTIRQLEVRGISVRAGEMKQEVELAIKNMGTEENHQALKKHWQTYWASETQAIQESLHWKIDAIAAGFQQKEPGLISSAIRALRGNNNSSSTSADLANQSVIDEPASVGSSELFDDEIMSRVDDGLGELVQQAAVNGVPSVSVRTALATRSSTDMDSLNQTVREQLQTSLSNPGSATQRFFHKVFGILATVLPPLAMAWAGYRIVTAFHAGAATPAAYLSSNFAINALLLVALAWALPYFLYRRSRPSRIRAARKGLGNGLEQALEQHGSQITEALQEVQTDRNQFERDGIALFNAYPSQPDTSLEANKPLSRALLRESEENH